MRTTVFSEWFALPHTVKVPPNPAHLPERFGLFTLILLGEGVTFTQRERLVSRTLSVLAVSALAVGLGVVAALSPTTPLIIIVGLITLCAVQARRTQSAMHVARG